MLIKRLGWVLFSGLFIIGGVLIFQKIQDSQDLATNKIESTSKKPNILIFMADDLDSRQLSCYGGENLITPNIDALAEEGLKFNDIYCSEAMCVPTRASLFTGLYPARHGSFQNHKPVYDSIKSVGHYLADEGYRVALTGKDHSTRPRSVFPFEILKGFEPNCVSKTDEYFLEDIRQYVRKDDKPFCLFVMSINPHAPWTVGDPSEFDPSGLQLPPNWVDTPKARLQFAKYLAEVRRLDDQVGDLVDMLKQEGEYNNTIFLFLGEQGPQFPGGKWTSWDYGQKSSMIVKWHQVVKPGTKTKAIVQYEDITPTLIDIAGGIPPAYLDGKSFLPVLTNRTDSHRDYAYGIHNNIPEGPAYPIRSVRNSRYKLIRNLSPEKDYYIKWMMNPKQNKSLWSSWLKKAQKSSKAKELCDRIVTRPETEFYDIARDPNELHNLAEDPEYKDEIDGFRSILMEWMEDQGDPGASMDRNYAE